jgi:hypothetical protein
LIGASHIDAVFSLTLMIPFKDILGLMHWTGNFSRPIIDPDGFGK